MTDIQVLELTGDGEPQFTFRRLALDALANLGFSRDTCKNAPQNSENGRESNACRIKIDRVTRQAALEEPEHREAVLTQLADRHQYTWNAIEEDYDPNAKNSAFKLRQG